MKTVQVRVVVTSTDGEVLGWSLLTAHVPQILGRRDSTSLLQRAAEGAATTALAGLSIMYARWPDVPPEVVEDDED